MRIHIQEELELQLLDESHAIELFEVTEKNRLFLREYLTFIDQSITFQDRLQFVREQMEAYQNKTGLTFAIFYQNRLVGLTGTGYIDHRTKSTSIGYWLIESAQGKGIMYLAVSILIDVLFKSFHLNRIEIKCAETNDKSHALIQRLGAVYEGRLREAEWLYDHHEDFLVHSILRSEWKGF